MGKKSYKTIQILTLSEGFESKHFKRLLRVAGWRTHSVQSDKMSAEGSKAEKKSFPSETRTIMGTVWVTVVLVTEAQITQTL